MNMSDKHETSTFSKHPPCAVTHIIKTFIKNGCCFLLLEWIGNLGYFFLQGQSDDSSDEGEASGDTESMCQGISPLSTSKELM